MQGCKWILDPVAIGLRFWNLIGRNQMGGNMNVDQLMKMKLNIRTYTMQGGQKARASIHHSKSIIHYLFFFLLLASSAQAQFGLGFAGMHRLQSSQQFNPAFMGSDEFSKLRVSVDAGGWLSNRYVPVNGLFQEGNYIDSATKEFIISKLGTKEVITGGYQLNLINVNARIKGMTWQFALTDRLAAGAGFSNPNTAGLILKGNKPYLNQTVSDENLYASVMRWRELLVGNALDAGNLRFGWRVKFLQGLTGLQLADMDYSLFTDSIGTSMDIQATYEANVTLADSVKSPLRMPGVGAGIDLGITANLSDKMMLSASILDIGMISFKTRQFVNDIDLHWEGIEVSSLFAPDIPEQIQEEVDSLRDLFLPDSVITNKTMLTPTRILVGLNYVINDQSLLSFNAVYSPMAGMRTALPLLSVGYFRQLVPGLMLGATGSALGTELFGFGLSGHYRIDLGTQTIDIALAGDNLLGFIPRFGRGMSAMASVGFNW